MIFALRLRIDLTEVDSRGFPERSRTGRNFNSRAGNL